MTSKTFGALRGVGARPAELPVLDGVLYGEPLLPAVPAYELSAALRNVKQPYVGVTTDGTPINGLYELADSGSEHHAGAVSAARSLLAALSANERMCTQLPIESDDWRLWTNAFMMWNAKGIRLERISDAKRALVLDLMRESLSAEGYESARDCMRLNGALGDLIGLYEDTLTEFAYNFLIFGEPNGSDPWGWQLAGHHVDINCVFVGSQLVLAPVFLGAEPNFALDGPFAGTRALDLETDKALEFRRALSAEQEEAFLLSRTIHSHDLPAELAGPFNGRHVGGAGRDNQVQPYEGIRAAELSAPQQQLLFDLVDVYLDRMPMVHAKAKRRHVYDHLEETRFCWRGGHDDVAAFYYRIHSPVLWVEYDNHPGIFLDNEEPERFHIHTIVREPNGNDYGKSLLAQHYARHHQPHHHHHSSKGTPR
ncbi:DUF3500 domain-containing protein [Gordonia sp. TBRC 11910]|uniref:DUF3500 domain-containing protein n=1 Tax=Gordonia asplenii TaxID=2725283 RepID=A0A848L0I4_9ACTN|nr:DUF3500 domain-containing protein [Gordonia asplenii]NMO04470.1 DUF3500 domain-containing protein [Gordonia asplenii]